MTGMKTSIAVLAVSAALSGPVLAQGVSVDSQTRTNARGAVTAPGAAGGASVGAGAGTNTQVGVPGAKAGVKGQTDTTGTLGAGGGAVQGAAGAAGKAGAGVKRTQP